MAKTKSKHYCSNGMKKDVKTLQINMAVVKSDIGWLKKLTIFTAGATVTTGLGVIGRIAFEVIRP